MSRWYYILLVRNDVFEITRRGPFSSAEERDNTAKEIYDETSVWDEAVTLGWADVDSGGGLLVGIFTIKDLEQ